MAHGSGRRRGEKVNRTLARAKWLEAIRQQFDGKTIGLAEMESLMPAAFTGNTRVDAVLGDTVAEAVRKGVLKEVGFKQWKVLPSSGRPDSSAALEPSPGGASPERDPKDQGELVEIPEAEWKRAREEFYNAFHEKRSGVTLPELQERREFFRAYAWVAIKRWLIDAKLISANGDTRVIRKPNTHPYRGGKDLFQLTTKGQEELVWMRRQQQEAEGAAIGVGKPTVASQPKKTRLLKKKEEVLVAPEKFDFATLLDQGQVVGVAPAGFSKHSERQVEALVLFTVLAEKVGKVTRDLYRQALRWKYQWGDDVTPAAVGRVLAGLKTHGLINISSVRQDQMPDPDDTLTVGSIGNEVLRSDQPATPAAASPSPAGPPQLQPDVLEEVRRQVGDLSQKVTGLEQKLGEVEKDRDAYRKRAENAEARIQAFVGAFAALIGRDGLVSLLQMLGVDPVTPPKS
jgi:DNA-binding PadR family transcriptional regulator